MDENYKYLGLPITPSMVEQLTLLLFNGKTIKRDTIANDVLDYHISNGGLYPDAQDFTSTVKKALSNLQKKGVTQNKSYGFWTVNDINAPTIDNSNEFEIIENEPVVSIENIPTHKVYGKGSNALYLYYFSNYRQFSELQGKLTWACKIGRTDRDPLIRILSQASTALPEKPVIEYVIKIDDSSMLETMIHSVLTIRGKHIKNSPGVEWFDTNPEEVLEIIEFVNGNILLTT